jgi:hypothetical protein
MSPVKRDEKTVAIAVALGVCVMVYIVGALLLAALSSILDFSDGVAAVLSVLLLIASMMAAAVIMLRDRSRRT